MTVKDVFWFAYRPTLIPLLKSLAKERSKTDGSRATFREANAADIGYIIMCGGDIVFAETSTEYFS